MRSLTITFFTDKTIELPLSYNQLVQGMLYNYWREPAPELHDSGYESDGKTYRLFTFSQLKGKARVNKEDKTIQMDGTISLEVRSPEESLLDELAASIANQGTARLGKVSLPVVNLSTSDRLFFPKRAVIHMLTPVTLHRTQEDGFTEYLDPQSLDFAAALQKNAEQKGASFGLNIGPVQLLPLSETLQKKIFKFKGININGWLGDFILAAEPHDMAFLYNCGLGARNSQGFGMFSIDDKPL